MSINFEPLSTPHAAAVMEIFNGYVESGTAAFPSRPLPEQAFPMFIKQSEGGYPSYAVLEGGRVIGFCRLMPYSPMPTFAKTAMLSLFLAPDCTGCGVGSACLERLIADGKEKGIEVLLAEVSSENEKSLRFHEKNGFERVGELKNIGQKLGRSFGVVLYQKTLA